MDTPSPELRRTHLSRLTTPKSVACRKIMNSPVFLVNRATDFSELSMSPLQLLDSPVQAALMTPGTSSGESSGRKSPRFLKQTSTPSSGMAQDTPTNKNKAFIIASNAFVGTKAKRRLIDEEFNQSIEPHCNDKFKKESPVRGNAAKKQKTTPKASAPVMHKFSKSKKRAFGQINSGVSHRIRVKPEKRIKPSVLSISLSDLKKAKAGGICKNPLDALNKTLPTCEELCISSCVDETTIVLRPEVVESPGSVKPRLQTAVQPSTPRTPKASVSALVNREKIVPGIVVSPKSIYNSVWSSPRYRKTEKKFFKSKGTEDRVHTVSINDNVKLQIQQKSEPTVPIRRSPRKLLQQPLLEVRHAVVENESRIEILNQDWDEDTMDMSSNIQDILNGLTEEEPADKVTETLDQQAEGKENVTTNKFFPLFCKNVKNPQPTEDRVVKKVNPKAQWMRARNEGENQMLLDAGQKEYGAVQCPDCMMVYHVKDPEDELLHAGIHESVQDALKYSVWKKERVVRRFNADGYIIAIHHGDPAHCWKKVENVLLKVVDQELGFSEIGIRNPEATKVFLYISEKKIVGVLVAQSLTQGYRMLPTSTASSGKCCSSDPVPALCGISRIWTLSSFRRRKTASRLLDAMRTEFIYGKIITADELAFSDPTENGLAFAQSYTKRQDFLVYNM